MLDRDFNEADEADRAAGERVLSATLTAVRGERARRKRLRVMAPVAAVAAVLCGMLALPGVREDLPEQVTLLPAGGEVGQGGELPGSWAVMVMRDGVPRLEEVSPNLLGGVEIRFSLDPVLVEAGMFPEADSDEGWWMAY
jgi:hypothetical protein